MKQTPSRAELAFRAAFERLKSNTPIHSPKGTAVSQNNVSREAGLDPSALKASRFPQLVAEIKAWVQSHETGCNRPTGKPAVKQTREKSRGQRQLVAELRLQRDEALSRLLNAENALLTLAIELDELRASAPKANITPLKSRRSQPLRPSTPSS